MPYRIVYRYSPEHEWRDADEIYETSAEAGAAVKSRNQHYKEYNNPTRFKVETIPLEDPIAWKFRERNKFTDGTYKYPPWCEDRIPSHLEHIDPDDPTKIRFFLNEEHAWAGNYTTMAPGRFYTRFIDGMPRAGVLEGFCAKMGLDMTVSALQFATTPDEIQHVYENGPHSCMAYTMDRGVYHTSIHPVRTYAAGDIHCAYITRSGDITGRCLVWPEKKIYNRIYGDSERMRLRLEEAGYEEDWNFSGAKLLLIKEEGQIVAPYIDGCVDGGYIEGNHIILDMNKQHLILKGPDGVVEANSCNECGEKDVHLVRDSDEDDYRCEGCVT